MAEYIKKEKEYDKGEKPFFGRKPKGEHARKRYYYAFRLDEAENARFEEQYIASGAKTRTEFILAAIFGRKIKTVVVDMEKRGYIIELSNLKKQYNVIGGNYNQAVKALKSNFSEKKALAMLYRLEQETVNLVRTNREIIALTDRMLKEIDEE